VSIPIGRKREISDLAEFIGSQYLTPSGVDLVSIVENNEISLSFGRYADSFDGLLELKNGQFHIYGNLDRLISVDAARSRFTVGHELGHFFIDEHRRGLMKSGKVHGSLIELQSDLIIENEADLFSANLLMPAKEIQKCMKQKPIGLELCIEISNRFNASLLSSAVRVVDLTSQPCAIFKWFNQKLEWASLSTELFAAGMRRNKNISEDLYPDAATRKVGRGISTGIEESITTADYWFSCLKSYQNAQAIFKEQAISLGSYGVLSFLIPMDPIRNESSG